MLPRVPPPTLLLSRAPAPRVPLNRLVLLWSVYGISAVRLLLVLIVGLAVAVVVSLLPTVPARSLLVVLLLCVTRCCNKSCGSVTLARRTVGPRVVVGERERETRDVVCFLERPGDAGRWAGRWAGGGERSLTCGGGGPLWPYGYPDMAPGPVKHPLLAPARAKAMRAPSRMETRRGVHLHFLVRGNVSGKFIKIAITRVALGETNRTKK